MAAHALVPSTLASFRVCPGTKTVDSGCGFGPDIIRVLDRLFAEPDLPQDIAGLRRQAYGYAHMLFFFQNRAGGRLGHAIWSLGRALLLDSRVLAKFGGLTMLRGFCLEVLLGKKGLARAMAWKSRGEAVLRKQTRR